MIKPKLLKMFLYFLFFTILNTQYSILTVFAEEENKLISLSKQIIEAKVNQELYLPFEELKELYFKDNKYAEFVEFLKSLVAQKDTLGLFANYYIALSRYRQLKYLEETQAWDEYFSQGNTYRDEVVQGAKNAIDASAVKEPLNIYARLLLWQFHQDQQDAFREQALVDLLNAAIEYSKEATDIKPIKDVAGQLSIYGERAKAKELYKIYIDKLAASSINDEELRDAALGFYKENNLELSELIYDVYIERISKAYDKEKLTPVLIEIAGLFSYKDEALKDGFYAEKIFKRIEELGTRSAFDEKLAYLRAFNLEKIKEYGQAKDMYIDLVTRYPDSPYAAEAHYKAGIICTYILRDIETGSGYFKKLSEKEAVDPWVISSLYQLGLVSQWREDPLKAKEYYDKLITAAASAFIEAAALAKDRLKEIEETRQIEYNLKTFLDASLKETSSLFDATKIEVGSSKYTASKAESVHIACTPPAIASGCMEVEVQYLWSGDLGTAKPSLNEPAFSTSYAESGTKQINLVVVSPSGVIDRNLIMLDIR